MNSAIIWAAAFALTTAADIAWTRYFIETERRRALAAGLWSASIATFGLFSTSLFIDHRWLVGTACVCGAFFGVWVTIKFSKK